MADSDCITLHGHITYHPMEILLQPRVTVIEREGRSEWYRSPETTARLYRKGRFVDITGTRVGTLTVVELWGRRWRNIPSDPTNSMSVWLCRCDCGEFRIADKIMLLNGARPNTRNGIRRCIKCQRATRVATTTARQHRRFGTLRIDHRYEYTCWHRMKNRCKTSIRYSALGYCKGLTEFPDFFAVLGPAPDKTHTIDRVDFNRGYHCGSCDECREKQHTCNVRWATKRTQELNKPRVKLFDWKGKHLTIREISDLEHVPHALIRGRVNRGWAITDAVHIPAGSPRPDRYAGVATDATPAKGLFTQQTLF